MKNTKWFFLYILLVLVSFSCNNSISPLRDGYTLHGRIIDLRSGEEISSVVIYLGYSDFIDSVYFGNSKIISDTLGDFVFKGRIATAPNDEVFRFEHPDYYTKDIILRNSAKGANSNFSLTISLQPKELLYFLNSSWLNHSWSLYEL